MEKLVVVQRWDLDLLNSKLAVVYYSCSLYVLERGGAANTSMLTFPNQEENIKPHDIL